MLISKKLFPSLFSTFNMFILNKKTYTQFKALLRRDIISLWQGKLFLYIARILLPSICALIVFILSVSKEINEFSGIPHEYNVTDLTLPPCFKLASESDIQGLGTKLQYKKCVSIGYFPKTGFTNRLMNQMAQLLNYTMDKEIKGYADEDQFYNNDEKYFNMYGIDFTDINDQSYTFKILYNQTYIDNPNFLNLYGYETLTKDLTIASMGMSLNPSSGFPLIIQNYLEIAYAKLYNIDYIPQIRQLPYLSEEGQPVEPKISVTGPLINLIVMFQFLFTYFQLSNDKSNGNLNSIRLAGVKDSIYIAEQLLFNLIIYLLGLFGVLFVFYGFPLKYDIIQFVPCNLFFLTMLGGGIYGTCMAITVNAIFQPKAGIYVSLIIIVLWLAALVIFMLLNTYMIYDPSIFPQGVDDLVAMLYPFIFFTQQSLQMLIGNDIQVAIDYDTFEYSIQRLYTYDLKSFTEEITKSCSFKDCEYTHPSGLQVWFIIIGQSLCMVVMSIFIMYWLPQNASLNMDPITLIKCLFNNSKENDTITKNGYINKMFKYISRKLSKKNKKCSLSDDIIKQISYEQLQTPDEQTISQTYEVLHNDQDDKNILIVQHLHKTYKTKGIFSKNDQIKRSVQSATFQIKSGEMVGLVGSNGAGKTTTIYLITGVVKKDKPGFSVLQNTKETKQQLNQCWINGYNTRTNLLTCRQQLGYCPQFNVNLYNNLNLLQNLELQCALCNIPEFDRRRLSITVLKEIGLYNWRYNLVNQLSGGMARRMSVAQSIVSYYNRLQLFDESVTGIDPSTKRIIWSVMKKHCKNKQKLPLILGGGESQTQIKRIYQDPPASLLTTHDMLECDVLSDNIIAMSDGQIVASGSPMKLKEVYSQGHILTIIVKNNKQQLCDKLESKYQLRLLDNSANTIQYEVKNEQQVGEMLHYLETLQDNKTIQQFFFEGPNLDSVFIEIAKRFQFSNGASEAQQLSNKNSDDQQQNIAETLQLDEASEFSEDKQFNTRQTKILEEQRQIRLNTKPNYLRSLLLKMRQSDMLFTTGWIVYILIPILIMAISFALTDKFIPWIWSQLRSYTYNIVDGTKSMCDYCEVAKYGLNVPMGQCSGFTEWGFKGQCEFIKMFDFEKYQAPAVYYGGDVENYKNTSNLYYRMESSPKVYVFDKDNILGDITEQKTQNCFIQGEERKYNIGNSQQLQYFLNSNPQYYIFNDNGTFANENIKTEIQKCRQNQNTNLLSKRTSGVVQFESMNQQVNNFELIDDLDFINGYDTYDNTDQIDQYYIKTIRQTQLYSSGLEYEIPEQYQEEIQKQHDRDEQRKIEKQTEKVNSKTRQSTTDSLDYEYIVMDDMRNLQALKQQYASMMPLGYMQIDKIDNNTYKSYVISALPARYDNFFYQSYTLPIYYIKSDNFRRLQRFLINNNIVTDDQFSSIIKSRQQIAMVPSIEPSLMRKNTLDEYYVSPQTPIADLSARLFEGVMRNATNNTNFNLRFAYQMMPQVDFDIINAGTNIQQVVMTTLFFTAAQFVCMLKFGFHIVQDRHSGMRRQMYLNGVKEGSYWRSNIIYFFILSVVIEVIVLVFTRFVIQSKTVIKMDTGVLFLITLGAILASIGTSVFLSSLFTNTALYLITSLLVLIISVIVTMFNVSSIAQEVPGYGYILPTISYVIIMLSSSYFATTTKELFDSSYGKCLIWMYIESILLVLIGIIIDQSFNYNGYKSKFNQIIQKIKHNYKIKKQNQIISDNKQGIELQQTNKSNNLSAISQSRTYSQIQQCLNDEQSNKQLFNKYKLNQIPENVNKDSQNRRDIACYMNEDRMDDSVKIERIQTYDMKYNENPIIIKNIQKTFNNFLAIRDVTLNVKQNQVLCLLGANGAAKTTTLNIVIGLLQQDCGQVFINGYDMNFENQKAYKHIGLCSQFDVFLPNLTVRQHLELFARIHGVQEKDLEYIVLSMAEFTNLTGVLDRKVKELSGGMVRRQSLALAII